MNTIIVYFGLIQYTTESFVFFSPIQMAIIGIATVHLLLVRSRGIAEQTFKAIVSKYNSYQLSTAGCVRGVDILR